MSWWSLGLSLVLTVFHYGGIMAAQENFTSTCWMANATQATIWMQSPLSTRVYVLTDLFDVNKNLLNQQYSITTFEMWVRFAYTYEYQLTTSLPPGVYTVSVGFFSLDWKTNYKWIDSVCTFTVSAPPIRGGVTRTVATVNGQVCDVYSWPDSKGLTRTVSLKREGNGNAEHGGYAVQMTYKIAQTGRQVTVNWDIRNGDGGFGYFVSHEQYRNFVSGAQGPIANVIFNTDDSPLGRYFQVTGQALPSTSTSSAAHRFATTYSHYGTAVPVKKGSDGNDATPLSMNKADYKLYPMTVTITWVFEEGRDFPRIDTKVDMSNIGKADLVSMDFRGPYGVMVFDNGTNGVVSNIKFGDRYHFVVTDTPVTRDSKWAWNTPNQGARYHALIAGQYEMGLFEPKLYYESTLVDNWNEARGKTSATYTPQYAYCSKPSFPCDFPYQSLQFSLPTSGVTEFKKIAWGSTSFYGTSVTSVHDGTASQTFNGFPANKAVSYSLCLVLGLTTSNGLTKTAAASKSTFNCATATYN